MSSEQIDSESATRSFFHNMWEGTGAVPRDQGPLTHDDEEEEEDNDVGDDFDEYAIGDDEEFGEFDETSEDVVLPISEPTPQLDQHPDHSPMVYMELPISRLAY